MDAGEEVRQLTKELSIKMPTTLPSGIWYRVSQRTKNKYPNGWFGSSKQQVMKLVYDTRERVLGAGDVFRTVEHAIYKNTKDTGQPFLICNLAIPHKTDHTKMDRLMGFAHPALLGLLNGNVNLFVDTTFSCTPRPFYQTLIVMTFDQQTQYYVPVMWFLMMSKCASLYFEAFHHVISNTDWHLHPVTITADFERALVLELKNQFKSSKINGCLFHWKQACRRKMKDLHIPDDQIKIAMTKNVMDILAVVPPDELKSKGIPFVHSLILEKIKSAGIKMTNAHKKYWDVFFNEYFRRQWLSAAMVDVWNLFGQDGDIVALQNRTNNALEQYNQEVGKLVPCPHPTLLHFIEKIEDESRRIVRELDLIRRGLVNRPNYSEVNIPVLPPEYDDFQKEEEKEEEKDKKKKRKRKRK